VKLVFEADGPSDRGFTAERMWVEVREVHPHGYLGALDNVPSFLAELQPGDLIAFGAEHVIALEQSPTGLPLPYGQYALVSKDIIESDAWPTAAYRETPAAADSSGWVLTASTSKEPLVPILVDDLVTQFRILDSILDEPVGTQWVWNPDTVEYTLRPTSYS
jgi:hypothetical protein